MSAEPATERRGDVAIIIAVFVVLFGYDVFEAIANLQQLPLVYIINGIEAATPYWLLWLGIATPPILFAAALWVSRGLRLVPRAGVLLVGFAMSAQAALLFEELQRQIAIAALV